MMTSRKSAITLGFAMGAAAKFGMSGATEVSYHMMSSLQETRKGQKEKKSNKRRERRSYAHGCTTSRLGCVLESSCATYLGFV